MQRGASSSALQFAVPALKPTNSIVEGGSEDGDSERGSPVLPAAPADGAEPTATMVKGADGELHYFSVV